jgi:serine/threonine protein kinase
MFIKDIALGLQYLHSNGIVFSDLKPANIFINEYGSLKLTDLGCAKKIGDIDDQPKKGTPCYMSP